MNFLCTSHNSPPGTPLQDAVILIPESFDMSVQRVIHGHSPFQLPMDNFFNSPARELSLPIHLTVHPVSLFAVYIYKGEPPTRTNRCSNEFCIHKKVNYICGMLIKFAEKYLEELYVCGKCSDKHHRYSTGVAKGYAKCIYRLQEARTLLDLYKYNALNIEALSGNKTGLYSVRVDKKYRVEFSLDQENEVMIICNILKLSNHYK